MRPFRQHAAVVAVVVVVAGCGAGGGPVTPPPVATTAVVSTPAPTDAPTPSSTPHATPTTAPTRAPTPVPTEAGPVVIESTVYPYRLTVPKGPTGFIDAPAPWDGTQHLSTDSRTTDRARVPGAGLIFIAMTDTTKGIDAYGDEMEAKFRAWHGCLPTSGRRSFTAGELQGVAFSQSCANGSHTWVRAVLVGDGRALVAMSDSSTIEGLMEVLGGIAFVEP